jgi:hypothetical protein
VAYSTNDPAGEAAIGRRVLAVQSMHGDPGYAGQLASMWTYLVSNEGRLPRLPQLRYRAGEFDSVAHADLLLCGRETSTQVFLSGSWLTRLGLRPLVGIIGGAITYAGGQWDLKLNTAPVGVELDAPGLTAAGAAASRAVTLANVDRSVSIGDLDHLQLGAGFTVNTQPWGTP